jgi:hypothetical protein
MAPSGDAVPVPEEGEGDVFVPPWLRHYNRVVSRKPQAPPSVGPTVCSVCCTFFSMFGALFLFIVAGLMRSNYRYIHIVPGVGEDLPGMSGPVTYAGILYLLIGIYSLCGWMGGNAKKREYDLKMAM